MNKSTTELEEYIRKTLENPQTKEAALLSNTLSGTHKDLDNTVEKLRDSKESVISSKSRHIKTSRERKMGKS